ncbi:ion transporter [uncultured Methanobrevibacter sp.]|uniref:ion transporter n=1 Tax=uncultured Methanobrevibacter sp. TaxID=253161 RepID=UPI002600E519|nr:ion transporter [uncultured Methanobrevibacter sp.]
MRYDRKQLFYFIISILILVDFVLLFYVSFFSTDPLFKSVFLYFDFVLCIILWIEFFYSYKHAVDKKHYLKENALSIWGMFPYYLILLRPFRLIKLIHYIKLFAINQDSETLEKFLKRTLLDKILSWAIIFIFFISLLMYLVDTQINDFATAFWYVIVSITATGYGDVVPTTLGGRIVGIIAMIGGVLIFAAITAVISSIYVSKISRDSHTDLELQIDDLTQEVKELNKKIDELKKEKD